MQYSLLISYNQMNIIIKKLLILAAFNSMSLSSFGNSSNPIGIVQEFSDNLSAWCSTKNISKYSDALKELCSQSFRVNDEIMSDYVKRTSMMPLQHYDFDDYEKCLEDIIRKGVDISLNNIAIDNSIEFRFGRGDMKASAFVSAEMTIVGALNYKVKEIFKIKEGKISFIRNYDTDLTLNRAFMYCKKKKYNEAFDQFRKIINNSDNWGEKSIAEQFAISILLKKNSKLNLNSKIRNYILAHLLLKDKLGASDWRTGYYPILGDKNYECAPDFYRYKRRVISLPVKWWEKHIPYLYDKESLAGVERYRYYSRIFVQYRDIEKFRFPIKVNNFYGFLDENGKEVILPRFNFAYPFDEKCGLALVLHPNNRWGYINMKGEPIGKQDYEMCSEVFVNGKTYAIKDGCLLLLNSRGNILKSIKGYYRIYHKRRNNQIIAKRSDIGESCFDVFDFDGNLIKDSVSYKDDSIIGDCTLNYTGD